MVKLDLEALRYMTKEEFRVLTAVEMGMKNHEVVPTELIARIAGLRRGGAFKLIKSLHKNKLIFHDARKYDGYRLTYLGYDYLAIKALVHRGLVTAIGRRIGVGKESDIYEAFNDADECIVLKIHRLGRTSFRTIKSNRDYLQKRQSASWLYLSRLAALREFAYMKALHDHDFPTPIPIDHNRHCVLMSLVKGTLLCQVKHLRQPSVLYCSLMNMIVRLAEHGLIHCDFNEFNLILDDDERAIMIDFPQMVSTSHRNAEMYFDRDVQCVRTFFRKQFGYDAHEFPHFYEDLSRKLDLDVQLRASGNIPSAEDQEELDAYLQAQYESGERQQFQESEEDDDEEEEEEEDGEEKEKEDEDEEDVEEEEESEEGADDDTARLQEQDEAKSAGIAPSFAFSVDEQVPGLGTSAHPPLEFFVPVVVAANGAGDAGAAESHSQHASELPQKTQKSRRRKNASNKGRNNMKDRTQRKAREQLREWRCN